jgi:hypothetical protein
LPFDSFSHVHSKKVGHYLLEVFVDRTALALLQPRWLAFCHAQNVRMALLFGGTHVSNLTSYGGDLSLLPPFVRRLGRVIGCVGDRDHPLPHPTADRTVAN